MTVPAFPNSTSISCTYIPLDKSILFYNSDQIRLTLSNLNASTSYSVVVVANSAFGVSQPINAQFTTLKAASLQSPANITVVSKSPSTLGLSWSSVIPASFDGYMVFIFENYPNSPLDFSRQSRPAIQKIDAGQSNNAVIRSLLPATSYLVFVATYVRVKASCTYDVICLSIPIGTVLKPGSFSRGMVVTMPDQPFDPVSSVDVVYINATAVRFSFRILVEYLPQLAPTSIVVSFYETTQLSTGNLAVSKRKIFPFVRSQSFYSLYIINLVPNTAYSMSVVLRSNTNFGIPVAFAITTSAGVPLAPANVAATLNSAMTQAVVTWTAPQSFNGDFVQYTVYYRAVGSSSFSQVHVYSASTTQQTIVGLQTGLAYEFVVSASSIVGQGPLSASYTTAAVPLPSSSASSSLFPSGAIAGIVVGVLGAVCLVCVLIVVRARKQSKYNQQLEHQLLFMKMGVQELSTQVKSMFAQEFSRTIGTDTDKSEQAFQALEIKRERLTLGKELGKGAFGVVYQADLRTGALARPVAVKTLHADSGKDELTKFLMEARLMSLLSHPNLLELVAVCTKETPFYLVTEFMSKGDLRQFLRDCRPSNGSASKNLIKVSDMHLMTVQIADAMTFLERRHVIHRDLAARNVLVGENNIVKLADFGMSRNVESDYYKKTSDDRVPVKWMAPESISERIYTSLSDVWSFGILLWEIYSYGKSPYHEYSAVEAIAAVSAGYRLPKPDDCPDLVYMMMLRMWMFNPRDRICFTDIYAELESVDLASVIISDKAPKKSQFPEVSNKGSKNANVTKSNGYVDDVVEKPKPASQLDDGYVADGLNEASVIRPKAAATSKAAPSLAESNQKVCEAPQQATGKRPVRTVNAYEVDNLYAPDTTRSPASKMVPTNLGDSRPQLRAAAAAYVPDTGYIDGNYFASVPGFVSLHPAQAPSAKPLLRAGGAVPQSGIDMLALLANAGLSQYMQLFIDCGLSLVDSNSAIGINDFALQQLGIYDPSHRAIIIFHVSSMFPGVLQPALPPPASQKTNAATSHIPNPRPAHIKATTSHDSLGAQSPPSAEQSGMQHKKRKAVVASKIQLPTFDKKPEESMTQEELNSMYGTADGAKKTKGK